MCICNVLGLDEDKINMYACVCLNIPVGLSVCLPAVDLEEEKVGCFVLLPGLHQYWPLEF